MHFYLAQHETKAINGDDCNVFNTHKLKKYSEIEDIDFIEEDD